MGPGVGSYLMKKPTLKNLFKIFIGIGWYLGAKKLDLTEIEQLLLDFILRASLFSEAYSGLLCPLRNYITV